MPEQGRSENREAGGPQGGSVREFFQWLSKEPVCDGQPAPAFLSAGSVSYWDLLAPSLALYAVPAATGRDAARNGAARARLRGHLRFLKSAAKLVWPHLQNRWASLRLRSGAATSWPGRSGWLLFGCFEPRQVRSLLPVVEEMRHWEVGSSGLLFSAAAPLAKWLPCLPEGAALLPVEAISDRLIRAKARASQAEMLKRSRQLVGSPRFQEIVRDWLGQAGQAESFLQELRLWFMSYAGALSYHAAYAERVFQSLSPCIFVATDDTDPIERVYFAQAARNGVPSLVVQYGSIGKNRSNWAFLLAQRAAVFGQRSLRLLVEEGIAAERIAVTGNPRFDGLLRDIPGARLRVRKRYGLPESGKIVLFTSQVNLASIFDGADGTLSAAQYGWLLDTVYAAASRVENAAVLVKPHPDESVAPHLKRISGLNGKTGTVVMCSRTAETGELIQAADAVVTYNSTTGMEALMAGIPLVTVCPTGKASVYSQQGVAFTAHDDRQLRRVLGELLAGPVKFSVPVAENVGRYLAEESAFPGQSAQRVCGLIREMIRAN